MEGNAKMILGSVYLLLGLAIMSMCFNLMQEKIFTQVFGISTYCIIQTFNGY